MGQAFHCHIKSKVRISSAAGAFGFWECAAELLGFGIKLLFLCRDLVNAQCAIACAATWPGNCWLDLKLVIHCWILATNISGFRARFEGWYPACSSVETVSGSKISCFKFVIINYFPIPLPIFSFDFQSHSMTLIKSQKPLQISCSTAQVPRPGKQRWWVANSPQSLHPAVLAVFFPQARSEYQTQHL